MEVDSQLDQLPIISVHRKKKRKKSVFYRYGFFAAIIFCMLLAAFFPHFGGAKGVINGNMIIWYFSVPLIYLEAGLCCHFAALSSVLRDGCLLAFTTAFVYILIPLSARVGSCLLALANVNVRLLKGMEVLYCLPPSFITSLVLSRIARADIATNVVTTLSCNFVGLLLTPFLFYVMLGSSMASITDLNLRDVILCTVIPLAIGVTTRSIYIGKDSDFVERTGWICQVQLLITAYHWFCDAFSVDAASLHAIDILLCVLIAFSGQLLSTCLCWSLCSRWMPREVLLAVLFASTNKSIGLGGRLLRSAFHGSITEPAVNLPLAILTVAQLLIGSLLAGWLSP